MRRLALIVSLMLFVGLNAMFAQTTTITGNITDSETGDPMPGVSVVVRGTTIGTVTNVDGNYSLSVPDDATNLLYSFVGMKTQDVVIGGRTVINVVLESEAIGVDEVIVTAIGIKRDTKALGYGVESVNSEEITRVSNHDVVNALAGKTAGVQISSSGGTAGASSYVTIRGASSLLGNNQPLFVVDGLPILSGGGGGNVDGVATSGRTAELNPDEIESMTILKGGAATALYGLQAANGAIVITTKKGSKSKRVEVNISSSVTLENVSQLPSMQKIYGQGNNGKWSSGFSQSWGPKLSESMYTKDPAVWTKPGYDVYGAIVPKTSDYESAGNVIPFDQYDIFQTGVTTNNNISLSSGSENGTFFLSIGHYDQEGILPNNTFEKTNMRFNGSTKINDKLEIGANTSYIHSGGNFLQQGSNVSGVMLGLLRTPPSFDNAAGWRLDDNSQRTYRGGGGYDNPYWVINEIHWDDDVDRFMGNAYANWEATSWLSVKYNVGTDFYTRRYQDYMPKYSRAATAGYVTEYSSFNRVINSDLLLNLKHDFSKDIKARLILGHNMYSTYSKSLNGYADGMEIDGFVQLSNTSTQTTGSGIYNYRTMGVFGDFQLDLYNMLYLGITGRNDWSTTMPEANISAFYPSVNVGFVFTELEPLKGNQFLSFGKLRASYAKTANIASAYLTKTYYGSAGAGDGWTNGLDFPLLGNAGFTWGSTLGNDKLVHETQLTYELGVDLKFLNNRYGADIGYFKNRNEDLLMTVPIAASTGYSEIFMNAGIMESYGWEIALNATPIKTNNFSWDIYMNYSKYKNPVIELADGVDDLFLGGFTDPQIRAVAGQEYRTIYGYDWYRTDDGKLLINDDPNDNYPDGFPMTDNSKMVPLGTVNPDWTANIGTTINYKGWSLSALIDIKHGGKMYNGTRFTMNYFGTSGETANREAYYLSDGSLDFERTPVDNIVIYDGVLGHVGSDGAVVTEGVKNSIPVVNGQEWYTGEGGNFGGGATTGAMEDAGWVRLREVSLSYTFTKELLSRTFLKSAQVYVSGKNLWLDTPYKGVDPETSLLGASNAQGMDYFNMPGTKSVTFGVRIGL